MQEEKRDEAGGRVSGEAMGVTGRAKGGFGEPVGWRGGNIISRGG